MRQKAFALAFLLSACATAPIPTGPATIPPGALDLGGAWRSASASSVLHRFQDSVARRYQPGLTLAAASSDLTRQSFHCLANNDARGDPPDQICRKTVLFEGCTHTWQVHLYDQTPGRTGNAPPGARLARTRALYDRRCGDEGLLGGPG